MKSQTTANKLIDATLKEMGWRYQSGTLTMMKANRPQEWKRLLELEDRINKAALHEEERKLRAVLGEYRGAIMEMLTLFKDSTQGSLFKMIGG